jgi:hypothetical protein
MSSVSDGLAANQPPAALTLTPPIGALSPGARLMMLSIFSPASFEAVMSCAQSAESARRALQN